MVKKFFSILLLSILILLLVACGDNKETDITRKTDLEVYSIYPLNDNLLYLETQNHEIYLYDIAKDTYSKINYEKEINNVNVLGRYGEDKLYLEITYDYDENQDMIVVNCANAEITEELTIDKEISRIILSEDEEKIAYSKNNSLYIADKNGLYNADKNGENEKLLLEGVVGGEATSCGYTAVKFIGKDKLLYHLGAYEGSIGFGIIDINTLENKFLENGLWPICYDENQNIGYAINAYGTVEELVKFDIETGTTEKLLSNILENESYYVYEWSETNIDKIALGKNNNELKIYNVQTGELVKNISLPEDMVIDNIQILGDNIFLNYYRSYDAKEGELGETFITREKI